MAKDKAPAVVRTGSRPASMGEGDVQTALRQSISTRQFVFMALGGSIGAGLLIASAKGLEKGGPGGLFCAFAVVGLLVWLTMCALGELSASFPVQGSFYDYSVQFIAPSWGFSMGWNYVINFILIVPFEITVMILIAKYWKHDLPGAALVPAFIFGLFFIQAFGARWYAEAEHTFGILKVLVLFIFVVTAIVIATGGTEEAGGRGVENWQHGKAFLNGGAGFLSVFVAAGMAYGGTEMLGLAVAECQHPRKVMPLAALIVIGRVILCYLTPLFMAGLVVKPEVFLEPEFAELHVISPFVVAVRKAGIKVLPDFINAILLVSVFSMANAGIYASSRSLFAICSQGMGPRLFAKTTGAGLPRNCLIAVFCVAQLSWVTAAPDGSEIFDWLLALASASNFFTWLSICVAHLRLRRAMQVQGRSLSELQWRSPLGIWGSIVAVALTLFSLVALLVSAGLPPVEELSMSRGLYFLQNFLGYLVVFVAWIGHLLIQARTEDTPWRHKFLLPVELIDLSALDVAPRAANEKEFEGDMTEGSF